MNPEDRYKAQWIRNKMGYPEAWQDGLILKLSAGTLCEKEFEIWLARKKAMYKLKMAIVDVLPNWLKRILRIKT